MILPRGNKKCVCVCVCEKRVGKREKKGERERGKEEE